MVFLALFLFPTPPIFAREDSSQKKEAPPGSPVCDTYQYEQVWLFKRRVVHVSFKMAKNIKITTCKTDNHSVHASFQTLLQEHKISASYWGLFSELISFMLLIGFLAVQDSSIGDIVSEWVIKWDRLLISACSEHYRAVVDNVSRAEQSRAEQSRADSDLDLGFG